MLIIKVLSFQVVKSIRVGIVHLPPAFLYMCLLFLQFLVSPILTCPRQASRAEPYRTQHKGCVCDDDMERMREEINRFEIFQEPVGYYER